MRKKLLTLGLVSIMMLSLTACGSENSDTANDTATDGSSYESGFEQASEMLTEVATEVDENADELKDATVDTVSINYEAMMADDLYMLKPGENFMYSPFSFNMALGMVANGGNDDVMMDASRYFDNSINGYNNFAKYYGLNKPNDLEIANSIWVRDEYEVNSDTNDKLLEYYNSEIYKSYWDSTLVENVNSWCDDKTHGMIPTILSDVPQSSNSILLNAIYFNGAWLDKYT